MSLAWLELLRQAGRRSLPAPELQLLQRLGGEQHSQKQRDSGPSSSLLALLAVLPLLAPSVRGRGSVLSTILKYAWQAEEKWDEPWYDQKTEHERNSSKILRFISDFLAFLVLYNFIIPISLYVTVEMQKFLGSFFIGWDLDLYHEETNQRAQVNTSDLNEELGQVEYVFTDKTGTLTENEMQFRECSINGIKYQEINGKLVPEGLPEDSPDGIRPSLMKEEELFLKAVCLCHTVHISADQTDGIGDGRWRANGIVSQLEYYASSPDEKALVEAASRVGVVFTGTNGEGMEVKSLGKPERFKLLHVLEFDPNRRRMSVIVESPSGEKLLFTKGAESSILPHSRGGEIDKTRIHVDEFALKGLRTLCVAYRRFTAEEYQEIDRRLHEARTALQQREERLADVFNFIEKDLELLGATGVEDNVFYQLVKMFSIFRLQDKVQETIEALRLAGIKVWVLTGDKHETAVSVVRLLKTSPEKPITLAIGDGANDTLYDSVYLTLYNISFTSLPILMYSLFEQHVHPHVLQSKPTLYRDIRKNALLGFKPFLYWTILGFSHAFVFFYGSYLLMGEDTSLLGNGQMFGNWTFGTLVFTVMVITVTVKMALETHFWTWINHFVTWGSIVFYFLFSLFYGGIIWPFLHTQDMYFVFVQLLSSGSVWFAIIIIVVTCLFLDVVKKVLCRHLQPTSTEKAQLTETGSGINCLDSMCCFSDGETACASVRRMLERLMGRCSPTRVNRCGISLNSLCCRRFSYKLEPDEPAAIDV
ncbi:Putative phospholipid-transporting ATPase IF [Chelonia mydas]|uniref:Putative phospholipid-transporting ATPase IF n=1 Tax=Chelonia mydas TaxID=8469 RepID=M7AL57_CHEMY|nr:Putative phospholipid-transporting ATPase IF [Chelonia mydas]